MNRKPQTTNQESATSKPVLIIHQGALGDVVLTFPAVFALREKFHPIHLLCQSNIGSVAEELGLVEKAFPVEAAAFASLYTDRVDSRVKAMVAPYHGIVFFSFSPQPAHALDAILPGKIHCIPPRPDPAHSVHVAGHILDALAAHGLVRDDWVGEMPLPAVQEMPRPALDETAPILIQPGSGSRKKNWAPDHFLSVATHLRERGRKPVFLLGPAEVHMMDVFRRGGGAGETVRAVTDAKGLVRVLKSAAGYIGNDSGVTHLAAFLGLRVVAVFGPSDPQRWRPVGRYVAVVRPDLDCKPCFETGKGECDEKKCLDLTPPEAVVEAYCHLLTDTR